MFEIMLINSWANKTGSIHGEHFSLYSSGDVIVM